MLEAVMVSEPHLVCVSAFLTMAGTQLTCGKQTAVCDMVSPLSDVNGACPLPWSTGTEQGLICRRARSKDVEERCCSSVYMRCWAWLKLAQMVLLYDVFRTDAPSTRAARVQW
jgi:hypothetical protein